MKIKLSGLSIGLCFSRNKGKVMKKVADGRVATVGKNGKVRTRAQKGDPEVEQANCPLRFIGIGMTRTHPEEVVEIGDGRPRVRGVRSLRER